VLFAAVAVLRFAYDDPNAQIAPFFLVPIALLGVEFGLRGGILGGLAATLTVVTWVVVRDVPFGPGEVAARCGFLVLLGTFFGVLGARLSTAVADRAQVAAQGLYLDGLTAHGMVRLGPDGVITGWNRGASEMLGYSEREILSRPLALIFDDGDAGSTSSEMIAATARTGLSDEERWIVAKDGRRRWAAVSVTRLGGGPDAEFALVLRDLTVKNANRHESSRMWEVSFEMLATARFDGYFQQVNPRWEEVLGWSVEELLARPSAEFIHPDDRVKTAAEMAKLVRSGHGTVSFENRYRCRDGSYRWLLWNSMASADDELIYAAAHDITDRKRREAVLKATEARLSTLSEDLEVRVERRTAELGAANKELEAFSYSVSHDLRAPLRAIDGYSQAVLEDYADEIPEAGRADLGRVRAASQRMSTMIDEMLALSRVGRRELRVEPVDLTAEAHEVVAELRTQDPTRKVDVDIGVGLEVMGDPVLLRLVLHNLIENAWKFTGRTEHARVGLARTSSDGGRSTFVVRDNGAGFDMRYADKLFRPFERLHRQDDFEGTGVGLTTVVRILNRHDGMLWAEGTPGEGAAFFFELPDKQEPHA